MNSFDKSPVELKPLRTYQGWSRSVARLHAAGSLMDAAHTNTQLRQELPLVLKNYSHLLKAYRRLGRIAHFQAMGELDAYVVFYDNKSCGLATLQQLQPTPIVKVEGKGAEISYWHGSQSKGVAVEIGKTVVEHLAVRARDIGATPWMVTLPEKEDDVKSAVNRGCGFVPFGPTSLYELNDGVRVPRQLWIPEAADAIEL